MKKSDDAYSDWTGDIFRLHREKLKLTQPEAAKSLGVSHRMICYYESGERPIPKAIELALSNALELAGMNSPPLKRQGTLTPFDDERIKRLADAMYYFVEQQRASGKSINKDHMRLVGQAVKEIDLLLSKFE